MSGFDDIMDGGTRMLVVPSVPEDKLDLEAIDRKTKEDLRLRHKLFISRDWECNTTAYLLISNMCRVINSHVLHNGVDVLLHAEGSELNFYDLFTVSVTNKKNERAEKVGNINVMFTPGSKLDAITTDYMNTDNTFIDYKAAYLYKDNESMTNAFLQIDELTRKKIKEKYDVILTHKWMSIAITYVFIENVFRYLITKIEKTGRKSVMINFNDIIEFHVVRNNVSDGGYDIALRPGYGAKLLVKSDECTEEVDEGDDY